jgi:hypothetical protein
MQFVCGHEIIFLSISTPHILFLFSSSVAGRRRPSSELLWPSTNTLSPTLPLYPHAGGDFVELLLLATICFNYQFRIPLTRRRRLVPRLLIVSTSATTLLAARYAVLTSLEPATSHVIARYILASRESLPSP